MSHCHSTRIIQVGGSGSSTTNLTYTASPTVGLVSSSTGADATVPLATAINSGLMSPAQAAALSATTSTNAQIGIGDTYIQVVNPLTGVINFVVDGVVEMTIAPGKITIPNILDPLVYAGTPMSTATRNAYPNIAGYLIYNSTTGQYEYNNGTTWLPIGGAGTITSVFGRSTSAIVSANGDYLASQVTNVPSGNISAVTVQAALDELDTEKIGLTSPLTGLSLVSSADITSTDTIIGAFGKLQAQLDLTSTAALTDSNIFVGNASNVAVGVPMSGQATITNAGAVTLDNSAVIGKVLTGFVSGAGVISATDSILQSIQKLDGNSKVDATETVKGIVELATQLETSTGTSTTLIPTVKTVADTYIPKSIGDNSGDLISFSTDNVPAVLALGADGTVLTADYSALGHRLAWKNPTTPKFTQSFVIADFVVGATESTLTILESVHLKGAEPIVAVFEDLGAGLFQEIGTVVQKNAAGDVFIKVSNGATVNGKVTII